MTMFSCWLPKVFGNGTGDVAGDVDTASRRILRSTVCAWQTSTAHCNAVDYTRVQLAPANTAALLASPRVASESVLHAAEELQMPSAAVADCAFLMGFWLPFPFSVLLFLFLSSSAPSGFEQVVFVLLLECRWACTAWRTRPSAAARWRHVARRARWQQRRHSRRPTQPRRCRRGLLRRRAATCLWPPAGVLAPEVCLPASSKLCAVL